MPLVLADRVRETTTTTGTGTVTLGGAVTGFQTFAAIGNGNTTYYAIAGQGVDEWEVGIGTYTAAGTTLSRDTVLSSSNGGALVNFSAGTKDVFCDYPADRAVYLDTATNTTLPNATLTSNLRFSGTGNRITGDFTNGTIANRVMFQTSTANSTTVVSAIPSGTGTQANFNVHNSSDPNNASDLRLLVNASEARIQAGNTGTGSTLPLAVYTGGSERVRVTTAGDVGIGTSSPVSNGGYGGLTLNGTNGALFSLMTNGSESGRIASLNDETSIQCRATTGYISFVQGVSGGTERMRISAAGDVGIGTASPGYKLDVSGTANATTVRASNGIVVNSATISANYTIASGDNGMSAGPVTVAAGVAVTVSSGSVWTVV